MTPDDLQPEDLALWRQLRRTPAPTAPPPIDPAVLAAYLEGRLGETEKEQLESLLAENPVYRHTWLELTCLQEAGPMLAPRHLIARAQRLQPEAPAWRLPRRWALAAAWLLATGIGWQAGLGMHPADFSPETPLAFEQAFDLAPDTLVLGEWTGLEGEILP